MSCKQKDILFLLNKSTYHIKNTYIFGRDWLSWGIVNMEDRMMRFHFFPISILYNEILFPYGEDMEMDYENDEQFNNRIEQIENYANS